MSRVNWTDRALNPVPGAPDAAARYDLVDKDGNIVASEIKLTLKNEIINTPTNHSAANMNELLQFADLDVGLSYTPETKKVVATPPRPVGPISYRLFKELNSMTGPLSILTYGGGPAAAYTTQSLNCRVYNTGSRHFTDYATKKVYFMSATDTTHLKLGVYDITGMSEVAYKEITLTTALYSISSFCMTVDSDEKIHVAYASNQTSGSNMYQLYGFSFDFDDDVGSVTATGLGLLHYNPASNYINMYVSQTNVKFLYYSYNSSNSVYTAKYTGDLKSGVTSLATSSVPVAILRQYGFLYAPNRSLAYIVTGSNYGDCYSTSDGAAFTAGAYSTSGNYYISNLVVGSEFIYNGNLHIRSTWYYDGNSSYSTCYRGASGAYYLSDGLSGHYSLPTIGLKTYAQNYITSSWFNATTTLLNLASSNEYLIESNSMFYSVSNPIRKITLAPAQKKDVWVCPKTGWYKIMGIGGGAMGRSPNSTPISGQSLENIFGGGASGYFNMTIKYFTENEEVPYAIGKGEAWEHFQAGSNWYLYLLNKAEDTTFGDFFIASGANGAFLGTAGGGKNNSTAGMPGGGGGGGLTFEDLGGGGLAYLAPASGVALNSIRNKNGGLSGDMSNGPGAFFGAEAGQSLAGCGSGGEGGSGFGAGGGACGTTNASYSYPKGKGGNGANGVLIIYM